MRKLILIVFTGLILVLVGYQSLLAQRKDGPRRIEIVGDAAKVRRALIRYEMDQGWELGDEVQSGDRIIFRERLTGYRKFLSEYHNRHKFIIASDDNSTTVYATLEECADKAETDCRVVTPKAGIAQLDRLLESVKADVSDTAKESEKAPSSELSPIIAIAQYLKDMSIAIDEKKSTPHMVVTNYVDPKGESNTLVIGYADKDHKIGFYIYKFGNLRNARSRDDLQKYLRSLNDAITVGSFFVDDEQDIGYRHIISSDQPLGKAAFESIYRTMTKVALERRAEIHRFLGIQ